MSILVKEENEKLRIYLNHNQLKEVVITERKNLIKQEIDKVVYNVKDDPESRSVSIFEILKKTPFISIDADDKIKLKGKSGFKVLINGRPSNILARSPEDILQMMPASNILQIEVITNPAGRYDSEGVTGVINIITVKRIDDGYNGSVAASHNTLRSSMITNIMNVKMGRTSISSNIGNAWRRFVGNSQKSYRESDLSEHTNTIQSSENGPLHGSYRYSFSDFSYELDSLSLITATIGLEHSMGTRRGLQTFNSLSEDTDTKFYRFGSMEENARKGFEVDFGYQTGFKRNKEDLLSFAYQYSIINYKLFIQNALLEVENYPIQGYDQQNKSGGGEQTFQADYARKLNKLLTECGFKYIGRNSYSDFHFDNVESDGVAVPNPAKSRTFDYSQKIYSLYNSYYLKLKGWGFKAGARLERTVIEANYLSNDTALAKSFNNLFPSVLIQHQIKRFNSASFKYTRRIQRPGIWELNPFENQSNPVSYSSGNPDLRPVLTHSFQLEFSNTRKGFVSVTLDYSFANNAIQNVTRIGTDNISRTSFYNAGKNSSLGINFNWSYPISKKVNARTNTSLSYSKIQGLDGSFWRRNGGISYETNSSLNLGMKHDWRTSMTVGNYSNSINLQGKTNSFVFNNLAVSKALFKKQATVYAALNNPFIKYRTSKTIVSSANFFQSTLSQSLYRGLTASFSYRFGRLKEQMKKSKKKVENTDVSNENRKIE